jgi:hypothetical protein
MENKFGRAKGQSAELMGNAYRRLGFIKPQCPARGVFDLPTTAGWLLPHEKTLPDRWKIAIGSP